MTNWVKLTVTGHQWRPGRAYALATGGTDQEPDRVLVTLHRHASGARDGESPALTQLLPAQTAALPMYRLGATWTVHPDDTDAPGAHCAECNGDGNPCGACTPCPHGNGTAGWCEWCGGKAGKLPTT